MPHPNRRQRRRTSDSDGAPIAGLYAAGNDMASIMGRQLSGAGITLGPALTFGYIAGSTLQAAPFRLWKLEYNS